MADGANVKVWYVAEVTRGVTPASPVWKQLRVKSIGLGGKKDGLISEELTGDRQIASYDNTTRRCEGPISTYLFYGSNDDILQAAFMGTWALNTPSVGIDQLKTGATRRYFSIMIHYTDLLTADKPFHIFTGVEFTGMNISTDPQSYVTLDFNTLGLDFAAPATTAPASSTYGSLSTTKPMRAVSGTIKEGGVTTAAITEFSPSLDNGVSLQFAIGSATAVESSVGNSNSSGQVVSFFKNATLFDKFRNDTASSLEITCLDDLGNSLRIVQPRIVYTGADLPTSGQGQILITLPYQAVKDGTTSTNIYIERDPV